MSIEHEQNIQFLQGLMAAVKKFRDNMQAAQEELQKIQKTEAPVMQEQQCPGQDLLTNVDTAKDQLEQINKRVAREQSRIDGNDVKRIMRLVLAGGAFTYVSVFWFLVIWGWLAITGIRESNAPFVVNHHGWFVILIVAMSGFWAYFHMTQSSVYSYMAEVLTYDMIEHTNRNSVSVKEAATVRMQTVLADLRERLTIIKQACPEGSQEASAIDAQIQKAHQMNEQIK